MRLAIYPYKPGSKSARELAAALGVKRIKHEGSRYRPREGKVILNWGASEIPEEYLQCRVLNHPEDVQTACNKLSALSVLHPVVVVPPFTTSREEAAEWVLEGPVVCRTVLTGNSGAGIVLSRTEQELVPAPLYTKYIKKKSEWRVHIFCGEVIMVQRKVRNFDVPDEEVKWEIRNRDNGFVFQQHGIEPPIEVIEAAGAALSLLELDFGAADVIWNEHQGQAYVLEVNCAPGLEGTTLERYRDAVNNAVNRNQF